MVDIWDSDYEKYLEQFDIHGCARVFPFDNGAPTNMTLKAAKGINEGLIQNGYIVVADTIEELAEGLGLPAETLKKTVERQNENYDAGVDPDFGKDAHRLSAIRTAPFYGVRTSGYMLCTLDGITINENFQAVDDNGKAIEGLYVTGVGFVLCPHVSEHVDRQLLRPLRHLRPHDRKGSRREIRRSGKQRKATGGY